MATLQAISLDVLEVFMQAYNRFGVANMSFRKNRDPKSQELPFLC